MVDSFAAVETCTLLSQNKRHPNKPDIFPFTTTFTCLPHIRPNTFALCERSLLSNIQLLTLLVPWLLWSAQHWHGTSKQTLQRTLSSEIVSAMMIYFDILLTVVWLSANWRATLAPVWRIKKASGTLAWWLDMVRFLMTSCHGLNRFLTSPGSCSPIVLPCRCKKPFPYPLSLCSLTGPAVRGEWDSVAASCKSLAVSQEPLSKGQLSDY